MNHKEDFLKSCLILDTETTSKSWETAEIIEAGFVIRESGEWTIFQDLHKPMGSKIPPAVESICYITNKMVENCPSFIESRDVFQSVVDGYEDGYLVAHNHMYDMRVLSNHGVNVTNRSWICTWRIAKKLFNGMDEIESTNLPYLRFALGLDVPIEMYCHRAGNDSFITGKLLEVLVDMMVESDILDTTRPYGPQIAKWAAEPIIYEKMQFGKHKNVLMTDIPNSYWQWAAQNTDWFNEASDHYDPDLAASINAALGD